MSEVYELAKRAKQSAYFIANKNSKEKNKVLSDIAEEILNNIDVILVENNKDCEKAIKNGISQSMLDRLRLDEKRIKDIVKSIYEVISINDPIGEVIFGYNLPNGLNLINIRVPFGVIGIIYEARPNVTIDSAVLCLKAGSSVILRGSSHALNTNIKLVEIMRKALLKNNFPEDLITIIPTDSREDVKELMSLRQFVDVLIPRGGAGLIESVIKNSKIPVIETGIGNCHIYIDEVYNLSEKQIIDIIINSKTQRPSVCNAVEKLLIHNSVVSKIAAPVLAALKDKGVLIKGCERILKLFDGIILVNEEDWYKEYLDLIIAIKIVDSLDEAIIHINKYGSHHSDSIITSSYENAKIFSYNVDSSTVYVNASTRFTDGGQFGMGAEIGISTQKLHWRGPMSLGQLTTNKFIVTGNGQIRE
jgi:glutamate-5-semialdehyde dehydrogenase